MKNTKNFNPAGYREIEHTADWELEVWAPDLAMLLEQAARGMYNLSGMQLKGLPRQKRRLNLITDDSESLLVAFLSELVYFCEQERIGFDHFQLNVHTVVQGFQLDAQLSGAAVEKIEKEIKAVTFHRLQVQNSAQGLRVNIVFDV